MASPVHLVKNFDDVAEKNRVTTVHGSLKWDGVFFYCREGECYSRTGKRYISGDPLARRIHEVSPGIVHICEFMVPDRDAGAIYPVNVISGYFRKGLERDDAFAVLHDGIPLECFDAGQCNVPWVIRDAYLKNVHCGGFIYNPQTWLEGEEQIRQFAQELIDKDEEGAVFKDPQGIWIAGAKNHLQTKIVRGLSYDLLCTGVYEGNGKYKGTLGGLEFRFRLHGKPDGKLVTIKADGMTDYQRDSWWNNPKHVVGTIRKVEAMKLTPNGVLRQPKVKEERIDKEEADF